MRLVQFANESIDFQTSDFGDALVNAFTEIFRSGTNLTPSQAQSHPARKTIETLTKKYTGLTIFLDLESIVAPCTLPIGLNDDHIFRDDLRKIVLKEDANAVLGRAIGSQRDGGVNLKESRVYGAFEELSSTINISSRFMQYYKATPEEIAAVFTHELGHVFTYIEYCSRTVRTNQVLAAVHKSLLQNSTSNDHKIILQRAGELLCDSKDTFIELTEVTDKDTITTVIIHKALMTDNRSEMGKGGKNYNMTACEQLADQFAARHGFGRAFVNFLDKSGRLDEDAEFSKSARAGIMMNGVAHLFMIGLGIVVAVMAPVAVAAVNAGIFTAVVGSAFAINILFSGASNEVRYDTLRVRMLRIKEQAIHHIKDNKLTDKQARLILDDIAAIEAVVKKVGDVKDIYTVISNFIFAKNRSALKAITLQRDLEALAANDIFVKAKELSFLK